MSKSELITQIIKVTKSKAEEVFDILNEYSEQYLNKLLKVAKNL